MGIRSPASTVTAAARVLMKVRRNGNPLKESPMQLDITDFPLVWMRRDSASSSPDDALFAQFEDLLVRQQAFVILSEEGLDEEGHAPSRRKSAKRAVLWMKRHKAALRAYIQGMVLVEPSAAKRLAGKASPSCSASSGAIPCISAPAATTRSTSRSICSGPGCRLKNDLTRLHNA